MIRDGATVAVPGGKERLLLACLLVNGNRVVGADALIDALWPDGHSNASAALWTSVSRLRHILDYPAGHGSLLTTRKPGYLLEIDADDLDVTRFGSWIALARTELAAGRFEQATTTFDRALALWRGPALAEFSDAAFARIEAARLHELRHSALEDRVDAKLAVGRHTEVVAELDALVAEEPLRERRWGQLMLALYRSGRQADALRAYRRLRGLLSEQLGIEPSAELAALEKAVLRQEPELDFPASRTVRSVAIAGEVDGEVPLPSRLAVAPAVGFVGRTGERKALEAALDELVASGERRVVLVGGEAGVGKTTLVAKVSEAAHLKGTTVLYGRCDENLAIPYGPFAEVVSHYLDRAPASRLAQHDPQRLAELGRLVPGSARRFPGLPAPTATDADTERFLLFEAVAELLSSAATTTPVIVVLDDLHWADRPSLKLLCHLATRPLGPVLIIGTCRDAELTAVHPLTEALGSLRRERVVERLPLGGLSSAEVATYVDAAGHEVGEAGTGLAQAIHRETDGNPFFVAELLRHLVETGGIARRTGDPRRPAAEFGAGLPDSIREVVSSRVGRLGEEVVRILSTAAVIGQEFDLALLSATTGAGQDRLLDRLGLAERAALVNEVPQAAGRFRFAHALIQRTLYENLGSTRQTFGHVRVADALEALCGDDPSERIGELARHFLAAAAVPEVVPRALRYTRRAGDNALLALAPDDALGWYSQGIALSRQASDELEQARCLTGLGEAQRQVGDPDFRETLLEAARLARLLGNTGLLVRAALANNRGFESSSGAVDVERVEILEAALAAVDDDTGERARLLATLAVELVYHPDTTRTRLLADESVAVARRAGDKAGLLDALIRPYTVLMVPELAGQRLDRIAEAVELADVVGDPAARFWAFICLGLVMVERGDIDGVHRAHAEIDRIAAEVGEPSLRWISTWTSSWRDLLAGEVDRAERLAAEAFRIGNDSGQPDAAMLYGVQLFYTRWHQGRLGEMIPAVSYHVTNNPGIPAWLALLASAEALEGDRSRARELLRTAEVGGFELPDDHNRLTGTCAWAVAAAELTDVPAATTLYRQLAPWHDQVPTPGLAVYHCVAHSLGELATVLGRDHEAEEHFTEALRIHQHLRAPFFIAETKLALGRLLSGSFPDRARTLLTDAAGLAARNGYRRLQRLADEALAWPPPGKGQ
ncbi:AAA family ATPase [Amycolatopsis sp. H6(2020)]|nr:AAA family ATPase [Amycolatopsis sp. H6(2020)]